MSEMMQPETPVEIGARVYAASHIDGDGIHLFGYGSYEGEEIPDESAGGMSKLAIAMNCPIPKILLDKGQVVWGTECWWGPISDMNPKWKVIQTDLKEFREAAMVQPGSVAEAIVADVFEGDTSVVEGMIGGVVTKEPDYLPYEGNFEPPSEFGASDDDDEEPDEGDEE